MDSSSDQAGFHSPAGHHTWDQKSSFQNPSLFYLSCWTHERYKGSTKSWAGLAQWCSKVFSLSVALWVINWLNSLFILGKEVETRELCKAGSEPWQRNQGMAHRKKADPALQCSARGAVGFLTLQAADVPNIPSILESGTGHGDSSITGSTAALSPWWLWLH